MREFAATIDRIAATRGRLEKVALLAAYLAACDDADLDAAARFFTGSPLPPGESTQAAIGSRTITEAATVVFGFDRDALRTAYRTHGDLSEALASLYRPALNLGLFAERLRPATVLDRLRQAAAARGPKANGTRRHIVETLLAACADGREVAAVVKAVTGELRIGSREGLIAEGIARAFERTPDAVRRALAANGDAGAIALAARRDALASITPAYGVPLGFMLASPMVFHSEYREVAEGEWFIEDKFDGIRAQAHIDAQGVRIFSRTGGEITGSFPDLCAAFDALRDEACILDGEIVAAKNGSPLPFRVLQPRLQRKSPDAALQAAIPVMYFAFDLLAQGETMLLDAPLRERRAALSARIPDVPSSAVLVAPAHMLESEAPTIEDAFAAARARGNEGLMFKRADSPYTPGRRGKSWIKLKQELDTLDVVVVGVEWGHGKRVKMLSDYTFAVKGKAGLLTIGKAYSGLTDAEINELTPWFLERQTGMLTRRTLAVAPELVIEIAFDIIQPSTINESGYSLRFPRIVRIRRDKSPADINTIEDVHEIHRLMLERENVP